MNSSQNFLCWFEDEQNNYLSFPSKIQPCQLFHFKKQQKIFQQHGSNCKCFVTQFFWWFQSGNTCDETTGKETEFSLVVSLEINIIIYIIYSSIQCDWEREEILFCLMISSSWSSPASCSHSWSCPATPWSWSNISHNYEFHIIPFHPQWPPDLLKPIYVTLNLMFRLNMFLKITLFCTLIITLITRILEILICCHCIDFRVRLVLTSLNTTATSG